MNQYLANCRHHYPHEDFPDDIMQPTILTATGKTVNLVDTDIETINMADICHSLNQLCRFTGHTKHFYSVLKHSVLVAWLLPQELHKFALLHDASAAYLGDCSKLKLILPDYQAIESQMDAKIAERFELNWTPEIHDMVKRADNTMLRFEMLVLMNGRQAHTNGHELETPPEEIDAETLIQMIGTETFSPPEVWVQMMIDCAEREREPVDFDSPGGQA